MSDRRARRRRTVVGGGFALRGAAARSLGVAGGRVPRWRETHCDGRAVAVRPAWGAAGKAQAREHGTGEGAVWVDTDYLWVERWRCGGAARAVDVTATGDNGEWAGRASPRRVAPPARNQWYSTGWRAPLTGPRAASPTGKISWISSHFKKSADLTLTGEIFPSVGSKLTRRIPVVGALTSSRIQEKSWI